jgi:hypothetical protein
MLVGMLGAVFNRVLIGSVRTFRALRPSHAYLAVTLVGAALGALLWIAPDAVGSGEGLVQAIPAGSMGLIGLVALLAARLLTTVGSYGIGLPGGIFAPLLALGTILGAAFAMTLQLYLPLVAIDPAVFAVASMGALFAATVRAPLTGIVLVIELTGAHQLALPILLTCLTATFTAEAMGGRPIYALLLGLGEQGAARRPARRIAAGAVLLLIVIALAHLETRPLPDPAAASRSAGPPMHAANVGTQPDTPDAFPTQPPTGSMGRPPSHPSVRDQFTSSDPPVGTWRDLDQRTKNPGHGDGHKTENAGTDQTLAPKAGTNGEDGATPRYAVQLISFRRPSSLDRFKRDHRLDRAMTLRSDGPWHPVLLGPFQTRADARTTLDRLPLSLRGLDPVIRQLLPHEQIVPIE